MYDDKDSDYFSLVRRDIAGLLPAKVGNVLEVGCGSGATLRWLKEAGLARSTTGIELSAVAAAQAAQHCDRLFRGDADEALGKLRDERFDTVLCLDVLEHLMDPWATLTSVQALVKPGGTLIVSLPNVRHHSVVLPLLFRGRWEYQCAGIMDRTHLRFFTRDAATRMLEDSGFDVVGVRLGYRWVGRDRLIDTLTAGALRGLMAHQWLFAAQPVAYEPMHTLSLAAA